MTLEHLMHYKLNNYTFAPSVFCVH